MTAREQALEAALRRALETMRANQVGTINGGYPVTAQDQARAALAMPEGHNHERTFRACGQCLRTIHGPVFGHVSLVAVYCSGGCRDLALAELRP